MSRNSFSPYSVFAAILRDGTEDKENRGSASIMAEMDDEFDTVDMTNMLGQSVAQFHYAANQVTDWGMVSFRCDDCNQLQCLLPLTGLVRTPVSLTSLCARAFYTSSCRKAASND